MEKVKIILGVYFLSMIGLWSMAANAKADYRVTDFGAKGDGKTLNSAAIQKAIDMATGNGGGTVVFPKDVRNDQIDPQGLSYGVKMMVF